MSSLKIVIVGLVIMLLAWFLFGFYPMWVYGYGSNKAGAYGDAFGMVNSFFSGFAFLAAAIALILQIKESRDARDTRNSAAKCVSHLGSFCNCRLG